jgi:hypothetical protein
VKPYYADEHVTLYHGDCREVTEWLAADVLLVDPPFGIGWKTGTLGKHDRPRGASYGNPGIKGDADTTARDAALALWGGRLSIVFGSLSLAPPIGSRQTLVYRKAPDAGVRGTFAGFRRDVEGIYLLGPWISGIAGRSSILETGARNSGGQHGLGGRYGHPHAKPIDVLEALLNACPPGVIADPFAGSGSTLVAARNLGRRAIGVEIEERYCELIARRLSQDVLPIGGPA